MHCASHTEVLKLVVVERGSLVSGEVLAPSDRFSHVLVVVQSAGETLASFTDRTASRLTRLESTGHQVVEAAVFVGACASRSARSARERLGRAVFSHLSAGAARELVFLVDSLQLEARHELLALAGSLGAAAATGRGGRVSVRFGPADGRLPARSVPGVSSGDTQIGMSSAGSAIGLASGYAGVSQQGHSREARHA